MPRNSDYMKAMPVCLLFALCVFPACSRPPDLPVTNQTAPREARQAKVSEPAASKSPPVKAEEEVPQIDVRPAEPIPQIIRRLQILRPDDLRQPHDDALLAEAGVRVFESKRLKLYTDIDANAARTLPDLINQLYVALEDYFGPLPPNRTATDFQMSGYLMKDMALFRELDLVPEALVIHHGRHLRNEFWMRNQEFDYYRRHLLIHESTHCFMMFIPNVDAPVWYFEGMAEYFGTHQLHDDKRVTFCVMPTSIQAFAGFDRITTIREDVAAGKLLTIPSILAFRPVDFLTTRHYAWSWALCLFLDKTPQYQERFRMLGRMASGSQFVPTFNESFKRDQRDLATSWAMFAANLQYGYDIPRATIDLQPGSDLTEAREVKIAADRGWQSSRGLLKKGKTYKVTATGQFTLADQPKSWLSEPPGISFRYFDGRPLGMLLGCLREEEGPQDGENESMLTHFAIGKGQEFEAPVTGTLYLRLNDAWDSLHDNRGSVDVTIQQAMTP